MLESVKDSEDNLGLQDLALWMTVLVLARTRLTLAAASRGHGLFYTT